jgi:tRNA (cmo5U34)-methyltransferase
MKKTFDFNTVSEFDTHISNSIPNYNVLSDTFAALTLEYLNDDSVCVDLGCSTGRFLNSLPKLKGTEYIGVDINSFGDGKKDFTFIQSDVLIYLQGLKHVDVIVCMFILQFLGKNERNKVLYELQRLVNNGAVLLLSEKVFLDNTRINQVLHREHIQQKRAFFKDHEILDKELNLAGCMFCKDSTEISNELKLFPNHEQVWQSYNFKAWCIY